ncbi:MAG: AI-2E family transporter [Elusimicrobia bacterium]|nr:AI-2E family transporter [Elusimicrobiota bacterium]
MPEIRPLKYLLPLILTAGTLYLLFSAQTVWVPFVLSFAMAYLLNPLVNLFETKGYKRHLVVIGVYLGGLVLFLWGASLLTSILSKELTLLKSEWPLYLRKFEIFNDWQKKHLSYIHIPSLATYAEALPGYLLSLIPLVLTALFVPLITFFILLDGPQSLNHLLDLLPSRHTERVLHLLCSVDESLGNFVRGLMIEAAAVTLIPLPGFVWLKMNYALLMAMLVGIGCIIPYIGFPIASTIIFLLAFIQYQSTEALIQVLILLTGTYILDQVVLEPVIFKKAVQLHPLVILLALMCGGELFGITGILFAIPAVCILKVLLSVLIEWHQTEFGYRKHSSPIPAKAPLI